MSEIFSSTPPFDDVPSCDIVPELENQPDFIEGINCQPSGCYSSEPPGSGLFTFLNCYITGLTGKLGLAGEESSVTVELIDPNPKSCSYLTASGCVENDILLDQYSGALGGVYTLQLGGFSFRGILTNHDYQEGSDGWKYSVTLTDGRQLLSNVSVIVNGHYSNVSSLQPNLINAVAIKNASVAQNLDCVIADPNYSGDGLVCENFGEAGVNQKGMYAYEAIRAIDNKKCKIPVSGLCLSIDLSNLLDLIDLYEFNRTARLSSEFMSALEIIDFACNESGYTFFTQIIDDRIVVIPVSQKISDPPPVDNRPLFTFMNQFDPNIIIDRDYGEELTFNKSQKLVLGQQFRYMLSIDHTGFLCNNTNYINNEPVPSASPCQGLYPPGAYAYTRINHNYFSGGATIINDTAGCSVDYVPDEGFDYVV